MPSALVIGANGYIGRHIARHLGAEGWTVAAADVQPVPAGGLEAPYTRLDLTDRAAVASHDFSADYLFYFAGLTGTDVSFQKYEQFVSVNELGLLHLLDALKGQPKKPKIVFPSTRLVYRGVENTPLTEDAEKEFKTIYASSKYNGELYLGMYRALHGQPFTVFRICVPYGSAFSSPLSYGTVSFFLGRAQAGQPISLFGDGSLKRTFTHVEDICRQMVDAAVMPESDGEAYNIAGETFPLAEAAGLIAARYGVGVTYAPWPDTALRLESGDTIFDGRKIGALLGERAALRHNLSSWIQTA